MGSPNSDNDSTTINSLLKLPVDVWVQISIYLSHSDICYLGKTSTQMQTLANTNGIWRNFCLRHRINEFRGINNQKALFYEYHQWRSNYLAGFYEANESLYMEDSSIVSLINIRSRVYTASKMGSIYEWDFQKQSPSLNLEKLQSLYGHIFGRHESQMLPIYSLDSGYIPTQKRAISTAKGKILCMASWNDFLVVANDNCQDSMAIKLTQNADEKLHQKLEEIVALDKVSFILTDCNHIVIVGHNMIQSLNTKLQVQRVVIQSRIVIAKLMPSDVLQVLIMNESHEWAV